MPISEVSRSAPVDRSQFHELLRRWHSTEPLELTIGDTGTYGQRAWLWVQEDGHDYRLNIDTTRDGVTSYLALVGIYGEGVEWCVVMNARGRMNKVAFGPERLVLSGFYFYLADDAT